MTKIDIATYGPAVSVTDRPNPQTPQECKFSMQYVVAHAAYFGSVRIDAFEEMRMKDPKIRALMPKISLTVDQQIDDQFPLAGLLGSALPQRLAVFLFMISIREKATPTCP